MKKLLRLTVAVLMLATAQIATAQVKMAPNYFRADPNVYKYRMAKVIDWKDSEDEQLTQYIYDEKGCLVREEYGLSKQPGTFVYNYTYNPQGYMIKKEEVAVKADHSSSTVSSRHEYTRNEYGYVTEYARATRHGTEPNDETLTEDVKMNFVYDDQMRLLRVDIRQFDYPSDKLEEEVGRICKVEYDEAGHVICVSQEYPGGELVWKEEFKYDEKGRRVSIKKVPGPNYTPQDRITWTWHYDNDGDIDKQGSSNGFGKEYEYDKSKLASETFMALEATEAEWALQGPLNCTLFKELPMEKYFTHAPIFETTDESEITYEPTGTPNNIADARTTAGKSLQAHLNDNKLTVVLPADLIGKTLQLFNATGACMSSFVVNGSQTTFNIDNFAPGIYVVGIGNQTVKFIKR